MKPATPERARVAMSIKTPAKAPRLRIHRAFVHWLEDARQRLLLPVLIVRIRRTSADIGSIGTVTIRGCRLSPRDANVRS